VKPAKKVRRTKKLQKKWAVLDLRTEETYLSAKCPKGRHFMAWVMDMSENPAKLALRAFQRGVRSGKTLGMKETLESIFKKAS
jgi:hypothetical protein